MEMWLDNIIYEICIHSTSYQSITEHNGCQWIYMYLLLLGIEVDPTLELYPLYFYIETCFTLKEKKKKTNL